MVQADDIETSLPKEWLLLWVADSAVIEPVPIAGADSCGLGLAQLASVTQPVNWLESLSNRPTVSFCSLGSGLVYISQHVVELPAGARGRFKVVAIDRTDPDASRVIQSPEVTFNGGIEGAFQPAILRTVTLHQSTEYQLRVIGAGLQSVQQASLVAPDASWEVPLTLTSVSDTDLRATAALAAWVPDCWVRLRTATDKVSAERISADPPPPSLNPEAACQARFIEDVYPPAVIQPKDFAIVPGGWSANGSWTFHLFYIRQNQIIKSKPGGDGLTEKNLGHAVSNDLGSWTVLDTAAIAVRPGRWDSFHVWAPTIVRRGVNFYMFYTGVDGTGRQRIGLATSTDLVHWVQGDSVLAATNAGNWVDQSSNDLRDPFVMEDPNAPGQWLLYFTARTHEYAGMATGFVRLPGGAFDFNSVTTGGPLWRSQQNRQSALESPHVFQRAGKWWVFFTKPISTQDTIYAFSNASSPSDTVTANWSPITSIRNLVPLSEATAYTFWHGTEYLQIAGLGTGKEYFAGFNDSDQSISYTQMQVVPSPALFGGGCPDALGVVNGGVPSAKPGIRLRASAVGLEHLELEIILSAPEEVVVAIHDVMGRRVRVIARGVYPAGRSDLTWDGTSDAGGRVASGIYYATLFRTAARSSVRAAFVR